MCAIPSMPSSVYLAVCSCKLTIELARLLSGPPRPTEERARCAPHVHVRGRPPSGRCLEVCLAWTLVSSPAGRLRMECSLHRAPLPTALEVSWPSGEEMILKRVKISFCCTATAHIAQRVNVSFTLPRLGYYALVLFIFLLAPHFLNDYFQFLCRPAGWAIPFCTWGVIRFCGQARRKCRGRECGCVASPASLFNPFSLFSAVTAVDPPSPRPAQPRPRLAGSPQRITSFYTMP